MHRRDINLKKKGTKVLARMLSLLVQFHLNIEVTAKNLSLGLRDLPATWISADKPATGCKARDAALILAYSHVLASPS